MEKIEMPPLYFSHRRRMFERDGVLLAESEFIPMKPKEKAEEMIVRFRTIGDITSTGATLSGATSLEDIIQEIAVSRHTERGGRADDKRSDSSMEERKIAGYF
jgi:sulfate adenylyltransferase subunit 2